MAENAPGNMSPKLKRVIETAFEGVQAPPELSVAIVSLVELCQIAMPDPAAIVQAIEGASFVQGPKERADEFGDWLALDDKVFAFPVRNLRHKYYERSREDALVRFLVSEGVSDHGGVVFVSTLFGGATEADAVKGAVHVTKKEPLTGANYAGMQGLRLRRVFWNTEGKAGMRGLMVTGPENTDAADAPRAFTAFNVADKKTP